MQTSESIAKLAPALIKAKAEFDTAKKTKVNPAFTGAKYAELSKVIDAVEPALHANELMILQSPGGDVDNKSITVSTRIVHSSGEWIEGKIVLPATNRDKFDPQSVGSAITYARRYALMGILGIAAEDDDGNHASGHHDKPTVQRASAKPISELRDKLSPAAQERVHAGAKDILDSAFLQPEDFPIFDENGQEITPVYVMEPPAKQSGPVITEPQAKRFFGIAKDHGKSTDDIKLYVRTLGHEKSNQILKSQYEAAVKWAEGK